MYRYHRDINGVGIHRKEDHVKLLRVFAVVLILALATSCNTLLSDDSIVSVTSLTQGESEALDNLVTEVYKQEFGQRIIAFYSTSYYHMPEKSDDPLSEHLGRKLDSPLNLTSAAFSGAAMDSDRIAERLKQAALNKGVRWQEDGKTHQLEIVDAFVQIDEGGAGGTMYDSNDMVTIVPLLLKVLR